MDSKETTQKKFIKELVDHLMPFINEMRNQKNKPGESGKTDTSKKIDKKPADNEDKEANFLHNRIADNL